MLVAMASQRGRRPRTEEATDHFKKLHKTPCPNHQHPVQHAYKDCGLLRKFLSKETLSENGPKP
jgi:hypothetical protein